MKSECVCFRRILILLFILSYLWPMNSCKESKEFLEKASDTPLFTRAQETIWLHDSLSIRSVLHVDDYVWYVSQQGKYGRLNLSGELTFQGIIERNNEPQPLRGIVTDGKALYLLGIHQPASIYRIDLQDRSDLRRVFDSFDQEMFLNSIQFSDNGFGIAFGDPKQGVPTVLVSSDGKKWNVISEGIIPKMKDGEHAFAASNSVLKTLGSHIWLATGGTAARVFHSPDQGKQWEVFDTPLMHGSAMQGIFTMDFYNETIGVIGGGDYDQPQQKEGTLAFTQDGGKSWQIPQGELGDSPGFVSCVKFVPGGGGKHVITVGPKGVFYSWNTGQQWKQLSSFSGLYTFDFIDESTLIAAGKNYVLKLNLTGD